MSEYGSPEPIPTQNHDPSSSRGRSISPYWAAAAAVATLVVGAGAGHELGADSTDYGSLSAQQPGHVYRTGETMQLLPGLPAKVEGWKVVIPRSAVENFQNHNRDDVTIKLVTPGSPENTIPYLQLDAAGLGSDGVVDSKNSYSIIGEPAADEPTYLIVQRDQVKFDREKLKGARLRMIPLQTKAFTLNFKSYHEAKKQKSSYSGPMIYSESAVGQEKLNGVATLIQEMSSFINPPDIYVFHSDDEMTRGGDYNSLSGRGEMGSLSFTNPLFKGEYLAVAYHELSHALLQALLDQQNDQRPIVKMIDAYDQWIHSSGFQIPIPENNLLGPDPRLENSSVIAMFDESHYTPPLKAKGVLYGHPYSNFNELFASAMTVMRFFPDKFASNFQQLSPQHKAAVRKVVLTIDSVLRSFPDVTQKDIGALQPSLDRLKKLK